jgi:hypothetical protein
MMLLMQMTKELFLTLACFPMMLNTWILEGGHNGKFFVSVFVGGYENEIPAMPVNVEFKLIQSEDLMEKAIQSAFVQQYSDFLMQIRNPAVSCFAVGIRQKCISGDAVAIRALVDLDFEVDIHLKGIDFQGSEMNQRFSFEDLALTLREHWHALDNLAFTRNGVAVENQQEKVLHLDHLDDEFVAVSEESFIMVSGPDGRAFKLNFGRVSVVRDAVQKISEECGISARQLFVFDRRSLISDLRLSLHDLGVSTLKVVCAF